VATIAHLANFYGPRSGGLRTSLNALADQYAQRGHAAHIVVPGGSNSMSTNGGITLHEVAGPTIPHTGGYRVILAGRRVRQLLTDISPDAIELSDRTTLLPMADWARRRGIPTTVTAHERLDGVIRTFARPLTGVRIADRINSSVASRVDTVVCTTSFAGQEFDRIAVPYERVPLGVDLETFHPRNLNPRVRTRFHADVLIMICSRLSKEKRPGFALDVLAELQRQGMSAHLIIAGSGPMERSMERRLPKRSATMLGYIADRGELAQLLASVDVVLAPGPIETFGLAALEAMASGTPVIANARSAIPEVIGRTGGLTLPLDAQMWAYGVRTISNTPTMRIQARARAEQFTWPDAAQRMLSIHGISEVTGLSRTP